MSMVSYKFDGPNGEYFVKTAEQHGKKLEALKGKPAGEASSKGDYTGFCVNRDKKDQFMVCLPVDNLQDFAQLKAD